MKRTKKYEDSVAGDLEQIKDETKVLSKEIASFLLTCYRQGLKDGRGAARRKLSRRKA
jgi:hypothetical protein